ncbi:MAG: AbrB/MazE/SpoVT family DNA-binding domain-containing protein [Firmicutes bacterium]|nr:AbrB/MazE/SpoVT family DNA-binding domain-containing protein [Bacillota bacterium]
MGIRVLMDDRGRLSIPSEIRKQMGFREGESVIVESIGPGELRVIRLKDAVDRGKGMYRHFGVPGQNISDELIADRRREAKEAEKRRE